MVIADSLAVVVKQIDLVDHIALVVESAVLSTRAVIDLFVLNYRALENTMTHLIFKSFHDHMSQFDGKGSSVSQPKFFKSVVIIPLRETDRFNSKDRFANVSVVDVVDLMNFI